MSSRSQKGKSSADLNPGVVSFGDSAYFEANARKAKCKLTELEVQLLQERDPTRGVELTAEIEALRSELVEHHRRTLWCLF